MRVFERVRLPRGIAAILLILVLFGDPSAGDAAKAVGAELSALGGTSVQLVIGADAGSKASKAAALGVTTLDEGEWLKLAGVGETAS